MYMPTPAEVIRVSVLADGRLLLDGRPVTLAEMAGTLDAAPREATAVWYYRENAAEEAPPAGLQVMKLIVERRLPVRLSSKPDFSDAVTPAQSGPTLAKMFGAMRASAAKGRLVVLRPDGQHLMLPAMARDAAPPSAVAAVERLLPSSAPRNVAAIADTSWTTNPKPGLHHAAQAIPFFGLLMGLSTIGHAVWLFDAGPRTLPEGCRDADLVIVDDARAGALPEDWRHSLTAVMRRPHILLYERETNHLRNL
jgi:hypothetical protein